MASDPKAQGAEVSNALTSAPIAPLATTPTLITTNATDASVSNNTDRPIAHKKAALKQQFSELPALDEWEAVSISEPVSSSIHDLNDQRDTDAKPSEAASSEAASSEAESRADRSTITQRESALSESSEPPIDWALDLFEDTDPYPDEFIEPLPVDRDLDETIARLSEYITDDFVTFDLDDGDRHTLITPGTIDLATLSPAELAEIASDNPFDSTDDEDYGDYGYRGMSADAAIEHQVSTVFETIGDDGHHTDDVDDAADDAADDALFDAILEIVNDWNEPSRVEPLDEAGGTGAIDSSRESQIEAELMAQLGLDGLERELEAAIIAAMQQVDPAASLAPPFSPESDRTTIPNDDHADRNELDPAALFTSIWDTLPPPPTPNDPPNNRWYLALDLGITELSAVLIDRQHHQRYPLAWSRVNDSTPHQPVQQPVQQPVTDDINDTHSETCSPPPTELRYRLPCAVYLPPEATHPDEWTIGWQALTDAQQADRAATPDQTAPGILIQDFQSCFEIGIAWRDDRDAFQPIVRWSNGDRLSLYELRRALRCLLTSLRCETLADGYTPEAADTDRLVESALPKLAGILVNQHSESNAAYRFNLREAIIEAGLVSHPGQITFVDAAWASVRSQVLASGRAAPSETTSETTLVVTADAAAIEFLVCEVTGDRSGNEPGTALRSQSHRVPYGCLSLELDVIAQLLLSEDRQDLAIVNPFDSPTSSLTSSLNSLSSDLPDLPPVGEPALETRIALRQWLQATPQGRSLLRVAREVVQGLQAGENRAIVACLETEYQISRRQFETAVLIPAIAGFNRELNHCLSRIGTAVQRIDRVILNGAMLQGSLIEGWLRQKCPNATLSQSCRTDPRLSVTADGLAGLITSDPNVSPVASLDRDFSLGLNLDCQRYDDYFVFHELLCNLPQQAITQRDARDLLERAGIPAAIADRQLPALLANHWPIGLIPAAPLSQWLDPDSIGHPIYQVLRESPLFECCSQNSPIKFQSKFQHIAWMRQYLYCLTMSTAQTFQDPLCLVIGWALPATIHR
ncbi:MAG: hypothetical protein HC795_14960 [Coleofasciculaceae cyanobacterium RL_1_1]|nr:hypothetical protein [Coleofasciculaceae cyanobacterium RL_1_1]